jgi:hypothetical protein
MRVKKTTKKKMKAACQRTTMAKKRTVTRKRRCSRCRRRKGERNS